MMVLIMDLKTPKIVNPLAVSIAVRHIISKRRQTQLSVLAVALAVALAQYLGVDTDKLPVVASAAEAVSEKAVSIGAYADKSGADARKDLQKVKKTYSDAYFKLR